MSVFFYAEGRSLTIPKDTLSKSQYFSNLLKNEIYSEVKITAPDWMPHRSLETYLNYLKTDSVPSLETNSIQKLLWISDYFNDSLLQEKLIHQILPLVNKDSALQFLQDATSKLLSGKYIKPWEQLQKASFEVVSKNLRYIFVNYSELFDKLDSTVAENIIEESLSLKFFTGLDHSPMLQRLKSLYGVSGDCGLLQKIEEKIQDHALTEVFTWNSRLRNLESDLVESPVFYISTTKWQLSLTCRKSLLSISACFKTEQICDNSVIAVYIQVIFNNEQGSKSTPKLLLLPLTLLKSAEIREVLLLSPAFSITINAKVEFLYSALVQEVLLRPEDLLNDELACMPFECLEFVLGLKHLAVRSEDTVLEIIAKWTDQQTVRPNESEVEDLLNCVRWDFISTKCLVSSVSTYSSLKDYVVFKKAFKEELENKLMLKHSRHKPRNCYKQDTKESFRGPKDYIETLAQVLLDVEVVQAPQKMNEEVLNEMYSSINQQETEIRQLKNRYSSLVDTFEEMPLTPVVDKLGKTDEGFYRVPGRLRNFSGTASGSKKTNYNNRRVGVSPLSAKNNKVGFLLGSLLKKLGH